MRTIVHGVINFGMVAIPVGVAGTKTTKFEPKFTTLHEACGTPIKQIKVCQEHPNEELLPEHLVKGYEVTKGQYAVFTQDEIDSVSSDRDKTINLTKFVKASDLNEYYVKMVKAVYWLVPPENPKLAEKYGLLYQCLAEMKRAGVGKESLWGKEQPCLVVPAPDMSRALQLVVFNLYEDIVPVDFDSPIPGREEKKLAKQIIEAQTAELNAEIDFSTEERERTHALIAARLEGEDLPDYGKPEENEVGSDLMADLQASYDEIEKSKKKVKAKA